METTDLEPDDRRKLEFKIIASRGDLLFSRALVLFEGETEELALPVLAEAYWGASVHELGFCFVGVGGSDYFPFIWLARKFEIPWFIFSDGEKEPLKKLMSNLKRAGLAEPFANVLVLPNGNDFEKQLVDEGFLTEVEEGLDQAFGEPSKLDRWMAEMHGTLAKKGVIRDYSVPRGREIAAVDHMRHDKTRVALPIAQHIAATGRLPTKVRELFVVISEAFGLQAAESSPSEGRASGVEGEAA